MEGRTVFITGGANGIGRSIVKAFHREGGMVAFCDSDKSAGEDLRNELGERVLFYPADVTKESQLTGILSDLFGTWGDIDILINNVGIGCFRPLTEITIPDFDTVISTNLRPAFITSRALAIHRNTAGGKKKYGRIINISSTRYLQSEPASEAYAASKGGIVSLTHALALSFSDYNITVNCISPGWIQTTDYDKLKANDHKQHPSGRVGMPDDIARTCLFLCREENDFINGQNIVVDGGMTKKMIYEE